jgi:hypothetical protein
MCLLCLHRYHFISPIHSIQPPPIIIRIFIASISLTSHVVVARERVVVDDGR